MGTLMNSKGQITIPAEIRAERGWRPGDKFAFLQEDGRVYLRRVTTQESGAQRTAERKPRRGGTDIRKTTDELMAMLRDE